MNVINAINAINTQHQPMPSMRARRCRCRCRCRWEWERLAAERRLRGGQLLRLPHLPGRAIRSRGLLRATRGLDERGRGPLRALLPEQVDLMVLRRAAAFAALQANGVELGHGVPEATKAELRALLRA